MWRAPPPCIERESGRKEFLRLKGRVDTPDLIQHLRMAEIPVKDQVDLPDHGRVFNGDHRQPAGAQLLQTGGTGDYRDAQIP